MHTGDLQQPSRRESKPSSTCRVKRRKAAPEHAQTSLKNAAEERGSEGQFEVILRVFSRADFLLQQSPQQKRHHCHRTYGYVAGASQQGVHQRRDKTRIWKETKSSGKPKNKKPSTITFLERKRVSYTGHSLVVLRPASHNQGPAV